MCRTPLVSGLLLVLLATAASRSGERLTATNIAQAIKDLGSDKFAVREKASLQLWSAGATAEPALKEAANSNDLEVKRRAREILKRFEFGVYPDTPKNIVDLVDQFRSAQFPKRIEVLSSLLALEGPGYAVATRIVAAEQEPVHRQRYHELLQRETPRIAAGLLHKGNLDLAEGLLEQAVDRREASLHSSDTSIRDYAAFLLMRGKLDEKIAQLSGRREAKEPRAAEVLAYLHRANGDLTRATRAADESGDRGLQRWLLRERGQWQVLLDKFPPRVDMKGRHEIEILGYQAAYQRLAGRDKEFAQTIGEIRKFAETLKGDSSEAWYPAEALCINDRPQDAIDVSIKAKQYATAVEFLRIQKRYREAFALANNVKTDKSLEAFQLELERAHLLHEVGEEESAIAVFKALGKRLEQPEADAWNPFPLIAGELECGLKDMAFEHAALILARPKFADRVYLFQRLFGDDRGELLDMWWTFLRDTYQEDDHRAALARVRSIADGTIDRDELRQLAEAAGQWLSGLKSEKGREKHLMSLGKACLAAGLEKQAFGYLDDAIRTAAGPDALLCLGDVWAERKNWQRAADAYGQAWEKDKQAYAALVLQGWALAQAGRKDEGEKRIKLAYWAPLGNLEARYLMVQQLERRGLKEWSHREWELSARIGAFDDWYTNNAQRELGFAAAAKGRFLEAADRRESTLLHCLDRSTGYVRSWAYVHVPYNTHHLRARGLLAAGRVDEALQEIRICLSILPAAVKTASELTPLLEKCGRAKDADQLFGRVSAHYEQICTEFPRCAFAHNELAWLSALCRRQLDNALAHAEAAVRIAPKSATYLDTLAEVHFQRGDRDKAIHLMRRCMELDPGREYYRNQLKRFEAGDRSAEAPMGE